MSDLSDIQQGNAFESKEDEMIVQFENIVINDNAGLKIQDASIESSLFEQFENFSISKPGKNKQELIKARDLSIKLSLYNACQEGNNKKATSKTYLAMRWKVLRPELEEFVTKDDLDDHGEIRIIREKILRILSSLKKKTHLPQEIKSEITSLEKALDRKILRQTLKGSNKHVKKIRNSQKMTMEWKLLKKRDFKLRGYRNEPKNFANVSTGGISWSIPASDEAVNPDPDIPGSSLTIAEKDTVHQDHSSTRIVFDKGFFSCVYDEINTNQERERTIKIQVEKCKKHRDEVIKRIRNIDKMTGSGHLKHLRKRYEDCSETKSSDADEEWTF